MNSLHLLHFLQRMIAGESRHPLGRAHGTLQPQDESIIVGYYTSNGSALTKSCPGKMTEKLKD